MWPWRKREDESFTGRIRKVEEDCMRRLDFVERHLDRMARNGPWQAQMTVVDADIMPVEPHLALLHHARGLAVWQWIIIVVCALIAGFMLGAVIF